MGPKRSLEWGLLRWVRSAEMGAKSSAKTIYFPVFCFSTSVKTLSDCMSGWRGSGQIALLSSSGLPTTSKAVDTFQLKHFGLIVHFEPSKSL